MKINNNHSFTKNILDILQKHFPNNFKEIFECSELLQYLNIKTKSANKGSKARGAFANHYALYVLIEDYLKNGFDKNNKDYSKYEGANFNDLFTCRALQNIDCILYEITKLNEKQSRIAKFILTSSLGQMSKMVFAIANRKKNTQKKYEVGSWVIGYWRPKKFFEINVWQVFVGRATRLQKSLAKLKENKSTASIKITCNDAVTYLKNIKDCSIDLVLTDPPHSDRIPYLELSEMWNTFLGYESNLNNELIYSNSVQREKTLNKYLHTMDKLFFQIERVLVKGGFFILIFNTTEKLVWDAIRKNIESEQSQLQYVGRFCADYSAKSVVQSNRSGSLINDWCLVISKGDPSKKIHTSHLPLWSIDWV